VGKNTLEGDELDMNVLMGQPGLHGEESEGHGKKERGGGMKGGERDEMRKTQMMKSRDSEQDEFQ
jgi:hypothetical protein